MTNEAENKLSAETENKLRKSELKREFRKGLTLLTCSTLIFLGSHFGIRAINNYVDGIRQDNPYIERVESLNNKISDITNRRHMLEEMSMDSTILPRYIGLTNERDSLSFKQDYKDDKRRINLAELPKNILEPVRVFITIVGAACFFGSGLFGAQLLYGNYLYRRKNEEVFRKR